MAYETSISGFQLKALRSSCSPTPTWLAKWLVDTAAVTDQLAARCTRTLGAPRVLWKGTSRHSQSADVPIQASPHLVKSTPTSMTCIVNGITCGLAVGYSDLKASCGTRLGGHSTTTCESVRVSKDTGQDNLRSKRKTGAFLCVSGVKSTHPAKIQKLKSREIQKDVRLGWVWNGLDSSGTLHHV